jgi:hypothetical protein
MTRRCLFALALLAPAAPADAEFLALSHSVMLTGEDTPGGGRDVRVSVTFAEAPDFFTPSDDGGGERHTFQFFTPLAATPLGSFRSDFDRIVTRNGGPTAAVLAETPYAIDGTTVSFSLLGPASPFYPFDDRYELEVYEDSSLVQRLGGRVAVPEPSGLAMAGLGLSVAGLLARRRARRAAAGR